MENGSKSNTLGPRPHNKGTHMKRKAPPAKKLIGRPPLPVDEKRIRLHISVPPQIAEAAKAWPYGVSDFFEAALKKKK